MKKSIQSIRTYVVTFCISFGLVLLLLSGCASTIGSGTHVSTTVGISATYSDLDEWGGWTAHARFGNVWYPYTEPGWAPFTYGNWVWTNQGWLWSSYEPYGWLVFHHGNWYYDNELGWFWVPGNTWSPAVVSWYVYDDYICWAPTPPRGVSWSRPWETNVTVVWTVVEKKSFMQENVGRHKVAIRPPSKSGEKFIKRGSPDIKLLAGVNNQKFEKMKVTREKTTMGKKTYYKTDLPGVENEKVVRYKSEYKKGQKPKIETKTEDNEKDNKKGAKPKGGGK